MNYPLTNMPSEAQTPALLDIDFQLSGALFETSWLAQLINTVWLLTGPFLALFLLYFSRDMALPLNVPIGFGWFFLLVVVPIAIQFAAGFRYGYRRQVRSRRLLFYPSEFIRRNLSVGIYPSEFKIEEILPGKIRSRVSLSFGWGNCVWREGYLENDSLYGDCFFNLCASRRTIEICVSLACTTTPILRFDPVILGEDRKSYRFLVFASADSPEKRNQIRAMLQRLNVREVAAPGCFARLCSLLGGWLGAVAGWNLVQAMYCSLDPLAWVHLYLFPVYGIAAFVLPVWTAILGWNLADRWRIEQTLRQFSFWAVLLFYFVLYGLIWLL